MLRGEGRMQKVCNDPDYTGITLDQVDGFRVFGQLFAEVRMRNGNQD
jgi:hypothetical protein